MPCRSDYQEETASEKKEREHRAVMQELACTYCKMLEAIGQTVPQFAVEWWTRHLAFDRAAAARKVKEAEKATAKAEALNKLSDDDKKALGLNK